MDTVIFSLILIEIHKNKYLSNEKINLINKQVRKQNIDNVFFLQICLISFNHIPILNIIQKNY